MAPLLAAKPGVDRAFERLYRRHALDVYRYAFGVLRNQADAEDVTQTTFLNAYRALERGETPQAPQNWLIAIAHNVCRQRFRQQSRRVREVGLDVDVADALVRHEDDDGTPTPEDIRRAMGHLAFNQRSALVMRELEGRSYAEIADLLGVTVTAVETLIFRARRALREQLEASWTCAEAEQALSRQLDKALSREEKGQLRAHLRECEGCRRIARSQRAQRAALRAFGAVPLPQSLAGLFGTGGTVVAAKAAAVVVAVGVGGGIGYHQLNTSVTKPAPKREAPVVARTTPTTVAQATVPVAAVVAPIVRHAPVVRDTPKPKARVARPSSTRPAAVEPAVVQQAPRPAVRPEKVKPEKKEKKPKQRPVVQTPAAADAGAKHDRPPKAGKPPKAKWHTKAHESPPLPVDPVEPVQGTADELLP
jgi:RNA polymerase sigma factor (sigma-70 family)